LAETAARLNGSTILHLRRHGKQIHAQLDRGTLYIHLGMTGKLLWNAVQTKYTRARIQLDTGTLLYDDVRQFGRMEFYEKTPQHLDRTGPDALSVDFDQFFTRLKERNRTIKSLLLDQTFVSGVGNIYADELLFRAGVHPRAGTSRISQYRAQQLHASMRAVLESAIEHRGSSISDYVDAAGERGGFQQLHNVYGRAGEKCSRCGTPIKRVVVAQRGTHYCPRCQRA
jgi:formamidopyrimidine-DNA glycosylase